MSTAKQSLAKQVIYVDVDDEITAIIDKMNASEAKVVALVLPKRASVFQSVVNMKLLKRRADSAKKHVVLITSEASLMPLAGLAGVHVAPTLQSKPAIPMAKPSQDDEYDVDDTAEESGDFDPASNATMPVGALAGGAAGASALAPLSDDDEVIELDNTAKAATPLSKATDSAKKASKDRKLNVPNFFSFRKRLLLAGLAVLVLGFGWYYAFNVMPRATVTITTNSKDIDAKLTMTLDTAASKVEVAKMVLPAQTKQEQKSSTGQAPATGQQNKGERATGGVTLSIACSKISGSPPSIPAGTGISANNLTFITQKSVELSKPSFSGGCKFTGDTTVTAEKPGTAYNVAPGNFSVAGYGDVTGSSSAAMTGGTDNNVKVVQQSDIDAAKQKLAASTDLNAIKRQLSERLQDDGLYPVAATFFAGAPNSNASANVGDEADTVTVTESVTYSMFGVKKEDLKAVIDNEVKKEINNSQQDILDNGLDKAKITVSAANAGPKQEIDVAIVATAGPKIDIDQLKQDMVGQKDSSVETRIKQVDGVENAEVTYKPFWITKAPKPDKITVQFVKSSESGSDGS